MTGEGVEALVVTACPGKHGDRVTGSVTDAELIILPAEADAMHVDLTNYQRGATAAGTEVATEVATEVETEVTVVMVTEEVVVVVVVVVVVTEAHQHSSLETGTAQTAKPITLPAVKHATNAMLPSECACHNCFCRLANWLAGLLECCNKGASGAGVHAIWCWCWCWTLLAG